MSKREQPREGEAGAEATAERGRRVQAEIDRRDSEPPKPGARDQKPNPQDGAAQLGQRRYPEPPAPAQHLEKPGLEADLAEKPLFQAPSYKGSDKLHGKVALITGGDSGIGRAVAVLYAREGADVAVIYLNEQVDAEETRRAVEAEGRQCLLLPGDVTDFAFCQRAVAATVEEFGGLDILVNNAAYQEHADSIDALSLEHFDLTLKTNLYGYFHMAKAAVPHLREKGAIVMTGSVTGLEGSKALLDYSMTKGGIHAFARSLAGQLLARGIRVNVVAPGPVWTPLNPADKPADQVASFGQGAKMKRPAQPEEIAPAFVFLAAESCSSYITGEILPIVGGY